MIEGGRKKREADEAINPHTLRKTSGVFLVTTRISIVPVKHDFSMNTDS